MREQQVEQKNIKPLSEVRSGEKVRLASIEAGRDLNSRLISMGLVRNVEITVVSNNHPGPFMISVKGSKMMLGRGMAHKIMVRTHDVQKAHSRLSGQSQ